MGLKVVILAGGHGTRLSEETVKIPKPMIEIGGKPLLWHIMSHYASYGHKDFIICCGYKGHVIKEYFLNYYAHNTNITIDLKGNSVLYHSGCIEDWTVTLVDTGFATMTGGRIKRIRSYLKDEPFLLTYGDGICDVDINELLLIHTVRKPLVTVTAIQPEARFGNMCINSYDGIVEAFAEKSVSNEAWINGGFFVCEPEVFDYIEDDNTVWEKEPLEAITKKHKLIAFKHTGFWKCCDTMHEKGVLEKIWEEKGKWCK